MQTRRPLSVVIPLLLLFAAITVSIVAVGEESTATVPRLITFSGTLGAGAAATAASENGVVLTSGTTPTKVVAITFSLYSEETGGAPLFSEVQNVQVDGAGHYTVQLGASKPDGLPMDIFASVQAHWLGVQPQGREEQPRVLLVSVPYALKSADAETFGGLPPSAYVQVPSAETNASATGTSSGVNSSQNGATGSTKPPVVTLLYGNGTPGYIPLWNSFTSQTSSVMYQSPGTKFVGIGTLAPTTALTVADSTMNGAISGMTTASAAPAILGSNQGTSGLSMGVKGQSASPSGIAVEGRATAVTGDAIGVVGESDGASGTGVLGLTTSNSGSAAGVVGQTNSPAGIGVMGQSFSPAGVGFGVEGSASGPSTIGVFGNNTSATGLAAGVEGQTASTDGIAVYGIATAVSGNTNGVLGDSSSPTGYGVYGTNTATSGSAYGVAGTTASNSQNASGVYGQAPSGTGATNGVYGLTNSTDGNADGVYGLATASGGGASGVTGVAYGATGYGVWAKAKSSDPGGNSVGLYAQANTGLAIVGTSTASTGILGEAGYGSIECCTNAIFGLNVAVSGHNNGGELTTSSPGGVGGIFENTGGGLSILARVNAGQNSFSVDGGGNGWFNGNVTALGSGSTLGGGVQINGDLNIHGNLSKFSGSFKIDDPVDPANKYLSHSFVESPDMMNIYNGVVRLDARGEAWVVLPQYFEALNRDFRYQLTSVGSPQPRLYIAREVTSNRFKISGGHANGKVSWQVTGIRHDAWANAHRIPNEEDKPLEKRGTYLYQDKSDKNTNAMLRH